MAAAVLGLAVPGVRVPTPRPWARRSRASSRCGSSCWNRRRPALSRTVGHAGLDEDDVRVRPGRGSRPRTRRRPAHEEAVEALRGRGGPRPVPVLGRRPRGHRDEGARAGPRRDRGRRQRAPGRATCPASPARWPASCGSRRGGRRCAGRPMTPIRSSAIIVANADQLVIVMRAGRPAAPAAADRPVPGRGLGRRPGAAAVPDQGRPGRPGQAAGRLRAAGHPYLVTGRPLTEAALDELRAALAVPGQRPGRPLRRGQVDAVQRGGPGGRPRDRHGQPGDRPRPAHLLLGAGAAAARRGLDHRHARAAQLRPRPRLRRRCHQRLPRPGRGGCGLPARLQPHRARAAPWMRGSPSTAAMPARLDSLRRLLRSREGLDPVQDRGWRRRAGRPTAPGWREEPGHGQRRRVSDTVSRHGGF